MQRLIIAISFMVFLQYQAIAQDEVRTVLEPRKIQIGEHTTLSFSYNVPGGSMLVMPVFNENITEKIEILHYGVLDSVSLSDGGYSLKRQLILTSWEEGLHVIEPFDFFLISGSDTIIVLTEPVLLEVEPVNLEEDAEIRDIKSILSVPITLAELKYYIFGAILLVILFWLIMKYLKKRKKEPVLESVWQQPDISAHVAAISSLELLKAQKLWQQGRIKEYHIRLNDILRHYLEKRFGVHAMEMTSSEIIQATSSITVMEPVRKDFHGLLHLADMVKFARYQAVAYENEWSIDKAFELVHTTREITIDDEKTKSGDNTMKPDVKS
jgi:hypothetical protein